MSSRSKSRKEFNWNKLWARISSEELVNEYKLDSYYVNKMKFRVISSATRIQKGSHILEPGCGTAKVSLKLAEYSFQVIALDSSSNAIHKARELSNRLNLRKKIDFVIGDIRRLPFRSNSFTLNFNSGVLEHFTDKVQMEILREMERVIQSNKSLIVITPNVLCVRRSIRKALLDFFQKIGLSEGWPWGEEQMLLPWAVKNMLLKLGLCDLETRGICFSPVPFFHPDSSLISKALFRVNFHIRSRWVLKICEIIDTRCRILPLLLGKDTVTKATKMLERC